MALPKFQANIVRSGEAVELVIRRNFDELASVLAAHAKEVESQAGGIARLSTMVGNMSIAAVDLSSTVILAPAASSRNVIQPTGAAVVPLALKGASSQSANLLQLQNSSATVLSYFDSNGQLKTSRSAAGSSVELLIENTNSAADSDAGLYLKTNSSSSAGDNYITFDNGAAGWTIFSDSSDDDKLKFSSAVVKGGTVLMTLNRSQLRVGIGTTGPAYLLDVVSGTNQAAQLAVRNTGTSAATVTLEVRNDAGSPDIDPYLQFNVATGQGWSFGQDQSDLNSIVLSTGTTLGTNNRLRVATDGTVTLYKNLILPTSGGTKIGTATSQLLGFWNATPVDQPAHIADAAGGATVDAEARTAIAAILDLLEETGLMAA